MTIYISIKVSAVEATKQAVRLVCEGLDTIATIYVNNVLVGKSNNQFVGYVFDVTGIVQVQHQSHLIKISIYK